MSDMDMIEKAARAICIGRGEDPDRMVPGIAIHDAGHGFQATFSGPEEPRWKSHAGTVRAVIEALRDPTDAMIEAGEEFGDQASGGTWRVMIDAALPQPPIASSAQIKQNQGPT